VDGDARQKAKPIDEDVPLAVLFDGRFSDNACHWQPVDST
jgi:hypothetical protein